MGAGGRGQMRAEGARSVEKAAASLGGEPATQRAGAASRNARNVTNQRHPNRLTKRDPEILG